MQNGRLRDSVGEYNYNCLCHVSSDIVRTYSITCPALASSRFLSISCAPLARMRRKESVLAEEFTYIQLSFV